MIELTLPSADRLKLLDQIVTSYVIKMDASEIVPFEDKQVFDSSSEGHWGAIKDLISKLPEDTLEDIAKHEGDITAIVSQVFTGSYEYHNLLMSLKHLQEEVDVVDGKYNDMSSTVVASRGPIADLIGDGNNVDHDAVFRHVLRVGFALNGQGALHAAFGTLEGTGNDKAEFSAAFFSTNLIASNIASAHGVDVDQVANEVFTEMRSGLQNAWDNAGQGVQGAARDNIKLQHEVMPLLKNN